MKNIYNLWLTEKTREAIFDDNGVKWAHLKQLYSFEYEKLVKLKDLNEISIASKSTERQWVSTCLRVFSEKRERKEKQTNKKTNHNAFLTQSGISADRNDTAIFINKIST